MVSRDLGHPIFVKPLLPITAWFKIKLLQLGYHSQITDLVYLVCIKNEGMMRTWYIQSLKNLLVTSEKSIGHKSRYKFGFDQFIAKRTTLQHLSIEKLMTIIGKCILFHFSTKRGGWRYVVPTTRHKTKQKKKYIYIFHGKYLYTYRLKIRR